MHLIRHAIAVLAAIIFAASPAAGASKLYLTNGSHNNAFHLYEADYATGELTWIGELPDAGDWLGLAAPGGEYLYGVTTDGMLYEITTAPFAATLIDDTLPGRVTGMGSDGGALLYMDVHGSDEIIEYDLSTNTATTLGTLTLPDSSTLDIIGGDLAMASDGQWYLWTKGNAALNEVDFVTMEATPLPNPATGLGSVGGLAIDYESGDIILGSSGRQDALVEFDPDTGAAVNLQILCEDTSCPTEFDVVWGDMASPTCPDLDGDGFSPQGGPCGPIDCNDDDPDQFPGGDEICNGEDDNCNTEIDETCIPASGTKRTNCHLEWTVKNPNNRKGETFRRQWCQDGDPTCDMDLLPGQCTFEMRLCAHVPDPRLADKCTPKALKRIALGKPCRELDPLVGAALKNEILDNWPGAEEGIEDKKAIYVKFDPSLAQNECTDPVDVVVEERSRVKISATAFADTGKNIQDRDLLMLRCLPAVTR